MGTRSIRAVVAGLLALGLVVPAALARTSGVDGTAGDDRLYGGSGPDPVSQ